MSDADLSLLNIYEVETDQGARHLVGFLDPVLAGSVGILSGAMVGEFTPDAEGNFDPETFILNPDFIQSVIAFMNEEPARDSALADGAQQIPGQPLYVVDPRNQTPLDDDPPPEDILGSFSVDDSGQIVPDSFQYNAHHNWFSRESGVSGMLADRRFYEWMHPQARREPS